MKITALKSVRVKLLFEGIRIVKAIKKLTNKPEAIPGRLVTESEHLAKQKFFTIEEVAVMIVQIALESEYIDRNHLTLRGEKLISEVERLESNND